MIAFHNTKMKCPECRKPQSRWVFMRWSNFGKGMSSIGVCPYCGCSFSLARYGWWVLVTVLLVLGPLLVVSFWPGHRDTNSITYWPLDLVVISLVALLSLYVFPYLCELDAVKKVTKN